MKKFLSFLYIILILAFIYVPIIILVVYSFNEGSQVGIFTGFSLKWYAELGQIKEVVLNTVLLALISSVIATVLGTMGAIGIFYNKKKYGKVINGISQVPVVNSEIVTACALVMTFILIGVRFRSYFGLYVGHIILSAPFVLLSVMPKLKQMDSSLYEAALDLGATPVQAIFKVVLPEILPGVLTGFMLAITLSLDDYIITATLSPLEFDTISTAVYKLIAHGTKASQNKVPIYRALTTIIFALTVLVVVGLNVNGKKKVQGGKTK